MRAFCWKKISEATLMGRQNHSYQIGPYKNMKTVYPGVYVFKISNRTELVVAGHRVRYY